jgi:transcriptional regulator with XRE-family HTH domain
MKAVSTSLAEQTARAMKKRRVALDMKQAEAAQKAGITLGTLQKFEQAGRISLERFLRLCHTYRMESQLIAAVESQSAWTLEQIKRADTKKTVRHTVVESQDTWTPEQAKRRARSKKTARHAASDGRNKLTPAQVKKTRRKEEAMRSKKVARFTKKAAR